MCTLFPATNGVCELSAVLECVRNRPILDDCHDLGTILSAICAICKAFDVRVTHDV